MTLGLIFSYQNCYFAHHAHTTCNAPLNVRVQTQIQNMNDFQHKVQQKRWILGKDMQLNF